MDNLRGRWCGIVPINSSSSALQIWSVVQVIHLFEGYFHNGAPLIASGSVDEFWISPLDSLTTDSLDESVPDEVYTIIGTYIHGNSVKVLTDLSSNREKPGSPKVGCDQ